MKINYKGRLNRRIQNINNRILEEKIQLIDNANFGFEKIEKRVRKRYEEERQVTVRDTSNPITPILVASSLGCGAVSLVSTARNLYYAAEAMVGKLILMANSGYTNSYQTESILNKISNNLANHAIVAEECAELAGKSARIGATLLAASVLPKICLYGYNEIMNKKEKQTQEEHIEELIELDEILTLIEDLKKDRQDISLNFIKEFLSQVDISKNSYGYNYELLTKFAKYRVSVLKELNQEGTKEETDKSFINIVKACDDYAKIKGASNEFLENYYVQNLVNTYLRDKEITLEQPEEQKTKRRRRCARW